MGIEGKEGGAGVGEVFLGDGVEVMAGRGKQDKRALKTDGELGSDALKGGAAKLDGEDDGDGIGRPGANLDGVGESEFGGFGVAGEGFADGAGEFGAVDLEGCDFGEGKVERRAGGRGAAAGRPEEGGWINGLLD